MSMYCMYVFTVFENNACVECELQADQLLRETHPTPLLSKDGQMLDAVFFEQFRSMLIDTNT